LRHFAPDLHVNGLSFYLYASTLVLLGTLGCVVVFGVVVGFTGSLVLAAAGMVYFVSEKLADELFRLRLFERDFRAWGRTSIARSVIQLAGFGAVLGLIGSATPAALAVLVLAMGNFLVFVPQMPSSFGRNLGVLRIRTVGWLAARAAHSVFENWLLWAIALLTSSIGYLDRMVALVLDRSSLPLFMLVVMCFSIVQMAVDYYYLSRHRRDFLEQRISVGSAFASRDFLGSLGGGLALAGLACLVVLRLSRNGAQFPLGYVLVIAVLQVSLALVLIPHEIIYWKHHIGRIFRIEVFFWASFVFAAFTGWWLSLPPIGIFALVVVCALGRLWLYIAVAVRLTPLPKG
jgi:hypothetical protein